MTPQKSPTRHPASRPGATRSLADVALIGAGLASAAASVVFAATMMTRTDHEPLINGMEYLAIFARPNLHATVVAAAPAPAHVRASATATKVAALGAGSARTPASKSIDFDPTGSIFPFTADAPSQADPYRLVAVEPGMAWLRNSVEMRVVKPGDIAPGLGRVAAIVKRDGRWTLVDESGAVLLAAEPPQGAAIAKDPFSRQMIFGGGG